MAFKAKPVPFANANSGDSASGASGGFRFGDPSPDERNDSERSESKDDII
jgi:hypothetical protein